MASATVRDSGEQLWRAARAGDAGQLAQLLRSRVDPNFAIYSDSKTTALHEAVRHQDARAAELAALLLSGHANVNGVDAAQNTPLQEASRAGAPAEALATLIKYKADLAHRNRDGATALHLAARSGREKTVLTLLNAGADPLASDFQGRDAHAYAKSEAINAILKAAVKKVAQREGAAAAGRVATQPAGTRRPATPGSPPPRQTGTPSGARAPRSAAALSKPSSARVRRAFGEIDTDKDGFISKRELAKAVTDTGVAMSSSDAMRLFREADLNANGRLSLSEFEKAAPKMRPLIDAVTAAAAAPADAKKARREAMRTPAALRREFAARDLDHSGQLSMGEAIAALGATGVDVASDGVLAAVSAFKTSDRNADGSLDFDEFFALHQAAVQAEEEAAAKGKLTVEGEEARKRAAALGVGEALYSKVDAADASRPATAPAGPVATVAAPPVPRTVVLSIEELRVEGAAAWSKSSATDIAGDPASGVAGGPAGAAAQLTVQLHMRAYSPAGSEESLASTEPIVVDSVSSAEVAQLPVWHPTLPQGPVQAAVSHPRSRHRLHKVHVDSYMLEFTLTGPETAAAGRDKGAFLADARLPVKALLQAPGAPPAEAPVIVSLLDSKDVVAATLSVTALIAVDSGPDDQPAVDVAEPAARPPEEVRSGSRGGDDGAPRARALTPAHLTRGRRWMRHSSRRRIRHSCSRTPLSRRSCVEHAGARVRVRA